MMHPQPRNWLLAALKATPLGWPKDTGEEFTRELLKLARKEGVLALLHHHLHQSEKWIEIPQAVQETLKSHARQSAAVELLRQQEINRVLDEFANEAIHPLLLKGTALAYLLYPEPHLRTRCDTDLLFPDRETANRAWGVLQQMGYSRPNAITGDLVSYQFSCYRGKQGGVNHAFDIHWKINNQQHLARVFDYQELSQISQPIPNLGIHAKALSDEYALLLACVHRIAHKPEGMENRLIWLYDIHLLMQGARHHQWHNLFQLAADKQLLAATLDSLQQAHHHFDSPLPEAFHHYHGEAFASETFTPKSATSRWRIELANFRGIDGWRSRLNLLREHLFPPREYMLSKYQSHKHGWLPVLYIWRLKMAVSNYLRTSPSTRRKS